MPTAIALAAIAASLLNAEVFENVVETQPLAIANDGQYLKKRPPPDMSVPSEELALMDVEQAWQQMGVLLSNARLPKRTWLLFHDTDLSAQWHGLYDDTPNPLMPQRD